MLSLRLVEKMSKNCTKKEIVAQIAKEAKMHPRKVAHVIEAFFSAMKHGLSNRKRYEFRGFGVFSVVLKKSKVGRNPHKAGVTINIPERYAVQFKSSSCLKKLVAK